MFNVALGHWLVLALALGHAQGFVTLHAQYRYPTGSWTDARALATSVVKNMTADEMGGVVSGKGQFGGRCVGNIHGVSRLSVPDICYSDGPAGLRAVDLVSAFPSGINAAATFNRDLIRRRGVAIGEEFRVKGAHAYLGPALDIMRAPNAGRAWEAFGADEYLTGEAGYETIMGVQSTGVQAVAKHLTAYIQEHYRFWMSSDVDDRTLQEIYISPYIRAIEADVAGIMCSYNKLNGTYTCAHPALMNGIVRGQYKFPGFFVSDWFATHDAVYDTAMAGLDLEMPGGWLILGGGTYDSISSAAQKNATLLARLQEMCINILTPYYKLGQDSGFPALSFNVQGSGDNSHVNARSDAHTSLIREIADASAILLKNSNNTLPLGLPASIAIIGEDGKPPKNGCDLNACLDGTEVVGWGSGTTILDYVVDPAAALRQRVVAQGNKTIITESLSNDVNAGVAAATGKAAALVLCQAYSGEYGVGLTQVDGNWGDRENLDLWRKCGSLIEAVSKVNKNTIVVIHTVGPVNTASWINFANITAVILAGLPGEQTGPSLMDVLYGDVNPSGRLPYTLAKQEADFPAHVLLSAGGLEMAPHITFTEGLLVDYKHFDKNNIAPQFEFGFGLSYTTFSYANLTVSGTTVSFSITNTGSRAGTEIPQLYLGFPTAAGEPPKLLRGFDAVKLSASETKRFEHSIWDVVSQSWKRPAGTFSVYIGASSRDIRLTGSL
ncbi:glycoside hydrolase superfamily [Auriculariales sp. MPI-PUGE-AT-0066]|nr:glycoside hydrolase superfamily [Auriculariales sp. MPI-PUGE-AT-0066]